MQTLRFAPCDLPAEATALRVEVRAFLAAALGDMAPVDRARSWTAFDPAFSAKLGARGWIGMTWPKRYGGAERSFLERYVVLEELLAAGAPVGAHWIADRQSGQLLLRFGTEAQRQRILPAITRGELYFCIGMSEPDTGSDLASLRTRAEPVDGGWRINGTKLWTSGAEQCQFMIGLFRTDPHPKDRHGGLTQFLVELAAPGITIRPIRNLAGEAHFNEVVFEDAFVADELRVGAVGDGWRQVTAELAFERSGPERYLSSFALLVELVRRLGPAPGPRATVALGRLVAELATLRRMSLAVAGRLDEGADPALEAAVVKDLGALFEQSLPGIAQDLLDDEPTLGAGDDFQQVLAYLTQVAPSFSLRGGTREILRGIIARGLGLR